MNQEALEGILLRAEELEQQMADPQVLANSDYYLKLVREHAGLQEMVSAILQYQRLQRELEETQTLEEEETDPDMRELLREELQNLRVQVAEATQRVEILLIPRDPRDEKNLYLEIRGGAGGEEAALFAEELFRMYQMYISSRGWSLEVVEWTEAELGGLKEGVFLIEGQGAFGALQYESGVHRVQRVPVTESGGRIHTSTVTVAILPEAEEVSVEILPSDLQIDTYRASGAGGQHVNKTDSAIRITHKPTGIVVTCQDQRSQYKNKDRAMAVLRARLLEREQSQVAGSLAQDRKNQVGSGDRSERIRTYNFPQGRVTDHRIGLTLYQLDSILKGELDCLIEPLRQADQAARLAQGEV